MKLLVDTMKNFLKLFNLPLTLSPKPHSLSKTLLWTLEKYYNLPLYGHRVGDYCYEWKSYEDMYCQAQEFQMIMNRNNVGIGDLVIICCPTSEEWVIADLACAMSGIVSIPLDPIVGNLKIKQVCEKTNPKAILCVDTSQFEKHCDLFGDSIKIMKIESSKRSSFDSNLIVDLSEKEDLSYLFTMQPTSGSTGSVKLTKRSRSNWLNREGNRETILLINSLSSPSSRSWLWTNMMQGGKVAESSLETLLSDCQIVHPTQVSAPPIIWDHVCSVVRKGNINPTASTEGTISWMNSLFGPKCRAVTNTGAGLSSSTQKMMSSLFGSSFGDGYGSSETGGIAVNGKLLPGVQIKLVDVPEMEYYSTDTPYPRGELFVKTTTMFDGYFNDDSNKNEWFPTGDIVQLVKPNEIRVIDRKSFTMKLKNGKFVSSTSIENTLKSSLLIQQVIVIVEKLSSKVIAVVVPNWDLFKQFMKEKDIERMTESEMCSSTKCKNELLKELKRIQISEGCNSNEILRGVLIKENFFTVKDGSLNPSLKISKLELVNKFSKEFQESNVNDLTEDESSDSTRKYLNILQDIFGHEISMGDYWTELGVNSLTATLIANKVNLTFNSQITASQIYRSISVENLAFELFNNSYLPEKVDEFTILSQDVYSSLPKPMVDQISKKNMIMSPPQSVFLTGASGFLGAHLVHHLTTNNIKVICLIRTSAEKFYSRLEYYGVNPKKDRITLLKGDISKPFFGMSTIEFETLQEQTHSIIHSAANVNWALPYSVLRLTNTLPVKTIMQLSNSNIPIHYISSIACAEPGSCETLIPDIPNDPSSFGYGTSKWASEYLLSRYSKQYNAPVFVYRPGHLVPISNEIIGLNETDFVSILISGCIKARVFPPYRGSVEWTCVDTCSNVIVQSVMKYGLTPLPREFNIFSSQVTSYEDLYQAMISEGYQIDKCTKDKWNEIIQDPHYPFNNISFMLIDGFKGSNLSKQYTSSNINYLQKGVCWPRISKQNIQNWIKHLRKINQIPPPP